MKNNRTGVDVKFTLFASFFAGFLWCFGLQPVQGVTAWHAWPQSPSSHVEHRAAVTAEPKFDPAKEEIKVHISYKAAYRERQHYVSQKISAVSVFVNGESRVVRHIDPSESGEIDVTVAANTLSAAERDKPLNIQAKIYTHFDNHNPAQNKPAAVSKVVALSLPPASTHHISWPPDPITFNGFAGTSQPGKITIQSSEKLTKTSFKVSDDIKDMLLPVLGDEVVIEQNSAFDIPLKIAIPANKPDGTYKGRVEIWEGGAFIASAPVTITVQKATASSIPAAITAATADRIVHPTDALPMVKDELLIGLDFNLGNAEQRIKEIASQTQGVIIGAIPDLHAYQLRYDVANIDQLEAKRGYVAGLTNVKYASFNVFADTSKVPFDEKFYPDPPAPSGNPWNNSDRNQRTWGQRYVGLPKAWDTTTGNKSIRIGVIDVGFDFAHPDLRNNIMPPDENSRLNSLVSNDTHGTYVAGTICAEGNNGIGIAGVMWQCSLGFYDPGAFSIAEVVETMHKAMKQDMRVVNMSFGWGSVTKLCDGKPLGIVVKSQVTSANNAIGETISWAKSNNKDMLWVFAAGNSCRDIQEVAPAALVSKFPDNTMAVAAIKRSENMEAKSAADKLFQSNYGSGISVAAPGQEIYTTNKPNNYILQAGTSLAVPYVSGLAGLVWSAHSDFTAAKVKQCIVEAANSNGHPVNEHSFKVIDAPEAVRCEKPKPSTGGSNAQCIFEMTNRPQECASTNPTVQVNFANVAGSSACQFESHLRWVASDRSSELVTRISNLAVGGVITLGTHTYTTPGDHYILQNVTPLTGGPCIILSSLYRFTLLSP